MIQLIKVGIRIDRQREQYKSYTQYYTTQQRWIPNKRIL